MSVEENIFTVSEVNSHLKNIIESMMGTIMIEGEISNFSRPGSGHLYFSLKDANAAIKCVFFRQYNMYLKFPPKNGDKVICTGKLTVYERDGVYQLQTMNMSLAGTGNLQLKFEALKRKLKDEGLFDEKYKQKIPLIPKSIGIITSASGAAFQDICNVISRRYPASILLYPATVQGDKAAFEIAQGIRYFNQQMNVDVLIVTRGGGSQEDLFCFNDEQLAREIFKSQIPVISAVGHEIDFTISDFVADLRAPTPSAAAELVVPDKKELLRDLKNREIQMRKVCLYAISRYQNQLQSLDKKMQQLHPQHQIRIYQQRLDQLMMKMMTFPREIHKRKSMLYELKSRLEAHHPKNSILQQKQRLTMVQNTLMKVKDKLTIQKKKLDYTLNNFQQLLQIFYQQKLSRRKQHIITQHNRLQTIMDKQLNHAKNRFMKYEAVLNEYSPKKALEKGYALIRKEKLFVHSVKQLKVNEQLNIDFKDGQCQCLIEEIKEFS